MNPDYQAELGERLRAIRNQQSLTLQDVEERSDGEWKAVVIGSYERGDRAISVSKLARLANFYNVPVADLLPQSTNGSPAPRRSSQVVLDLTRLPDASEAGSAPLGALSRYVRRIQLLRGDYNGRMLTLRDEDLEIVAVISGIDPEELTNELEERAVLDNR